MLEPNTPYKHPAIWTAQTRPPSANKRFNFINYCDVSQNVDFYLLFCSLQKKMLTAHYSTIWVCPNPLRGTDEIKILPPSRGTGTSNRVADSSFGVTWMKTMWGLWSPVTSRCEVPITAGPLLRGSVLNTYHDVRSMNASHLSLWGTDHSWASTMENSLASYLYNWAESS